MFRFSVIATFFFIVFISFNRANAQSGGHIYYVNTQAVGLNNGASWQNAFTTLSAALDTAKANDIIKVAKGTYTPVAAMKLKDSVQVLGGYPNTGNPTDQNRNWGTNQTILSGGNGQVQTILYGYHLHPLCLVDGFIIGNGNNSLSLDSSSSPVIKNCVFEGNSDVNILPYNLIFSVACHQSNPVFINCFFVNNGTELDDNSSDINCSAGSNVSFTNCVFADNQVVREITANNSIVTIDNCTFLNNLTSIAFNETAAGVVYATNTSALSITNSIFFGNKFPGNYSGTAYVVDSSEIGLSASTLSISNTITQGYNTGNAMLFRVNPKFKDTVNIAGADGLYYTADDGLQLLNPCSPAINTGINANVTAATDIIGNTRIYGGLVDLGPYETQSNIIAEPYVIYVNANATGLNNGTSWANAFTDLQQAIQSCSDTIKVAAGNYFPGHNAETAFWLENKRVVLGGYPSSGNPADNLRNPSANATILNGNISTANPSQSYIVVRGENIDSTSVLDGFSITGVKNGFNEGAAVFLTYNASPVIKNCALKNNGGGYYAAALEIKYSSNPGFVNCNISNNGGDYYEENYGAIYIAGNSAPHFKKCLFSYNTTYIEGSTPGLYEGGAMVNNNSSPVIDSCTFLKNTANAFAGGIYNFNNSNPVITNTGFYGNSTGDISLLNSGNGTDIYNDNSSPQLTNCIFSDSATTYEGGSVFDQNHSNPTFTTCTFQNGNAGRGGVCYNDNSNPVFNYCLFTNCVSSYGGVLYDIDYSSPGIYNSVASGNNTFMYNQQSSPLIVSCTLANGDGVTNLDSTTLIMRNTIYESVSDIGNAATPTVFDKCITTAAARFKDSTNPAGPDKVFLTADDGLTLCACSPAINTGDNTAVSGVTKDITNAPRIFDNIVDVGAYEYQSDVVTTQGTYYVNATATGSNDGTSWDNADTNLQSAILNTCADTIKVAAGVYKPAVASRDSSFVPSRPIVLLGGYPNAGNPLESQRDVDTNPTIISGDIGVQGDSTDNTYVLMKLTDPSIVDGFIFSGANNINSSTSNGAALLTNGKVRNCRFHNNTGPTGSGVYGNADISNSVFYNNNTGSGTVYNPDSVRDCIFENNYAVSGGGLCTGIATVVENTVFYGNFAETGGGVCLSGNPAAKLTNCDFIRNNSSGSYGIGLYNYNSYLVLTANPVIRNCIFRENKIRGIYEPYQWTDWAWVSGSYGLYDNSDEQLNVHYTACLTEVPYDNTNIQPDGITFTNIDNPEGADDKWFTKDDGLQLTGSSPGVDVGSNAFVTAIPTDINGNPRIFNGVVDMGAYEFNGINAGANATICLGTSKQLGAAARSGFSYSWSSNPNGFTSTVSNPIVGPTITTTYYVTATNDTTTYNDSVTITVIAPPIANAGKDTAICIGDSVNIGSPATNPADTYKWTAPSFIEETIYPILRVSPTVTTTYQLTVINQGCSVTDSVIVLVKSIPPAINAGNDTTICFGSNVTIGPAAISGQSYSWTSSPAGFISSATDPAVAPAVTTSYYLSAGNGAGACPSKDTVVVNVITLPSTSAGTDTLICAGSSVTIGNAQTSTGYAYSWTSNPTGFTSTLINPTVIPVENTYYYLQITKGGCSVTDTVSITVDTNHVVANAGENKNVCSGQSVTLGSGDSTAQYTYIWSADNGFTSGFANPQVYVSVPVHYYLSVTDKTCTSGDTVFISTISNPILDLQDTILKTCIGNTVTIGTTAAANYIYNWSSLPAGFSSTLDSPAVSPLNNTIYYILVTDTITRCSSTGYVSVITDSCTNNNGISIYPNPVKAGTDIVIYIHPKNSDAAYFELTDQSGATIANVPVVNGAIEISVATAGAYFYTILDKSQHTLKSGLLLIVN